MFSLPCSPAHTDLFTSRGCRTFRKKFTFLYSDRETYWFRELNLHYSILSQIVRTRATRSGVLPPVPPVWATIGEGHGRGRGAASTAARVALVDQPVALAQEGDYGYRWAGGTRSGTIYAYCDSRHSRGVGLDIEGLHWPCLGGFA